MVCGCGLKNVVCGGEREASKGAGVPGHAAEAADGELVEELLAVFVCVVCVVGWMRSCVGAYIYTYTDNQNRCGPELGVADEEELGVVLHKGVRAVDDAHEEVLLQNGVQGPVVVRWHSGGSRG